MVGKYRFTLSAVLLLCAGLLQACGNDVVISVTDEAGVPVANASIRAAFFSDLSTAKAPVTDGSGKYRKPIPSVARLENLVVRVSKEGFFDSFGMVWDEKNTSSPPLERTVVIKLKRRIQPAPMRLVRFGHGIPKDFGKEALAAGFDLVVGDFVKPFGIGEQADIVIATIRHNESKESPRPSLPLQRPPEFIKLVFANPDDGLIQVETGRNQWEVNSWFIAPHQAPETGYSPQTEMVSGGLYSPYNGPEHDNTFVNGPIEKTASPEKMLLFRVRSKRNDKGEVVSASYGWFSNSIKFHTGQDGRFWWMLSYYINDNRDSKSLEPETFVDIPPE